MCIAKIEEYEVLGMMDESWMSRHCRMSKWAQMPNSGKAIRFGVLWHPDFLSSCCLHQHRWFQQASPTAYDTHLRMHRIEIS